MFSYGVLIDMAFLVGMTVIVYCGNGIGYGQGKQDKVGTNMRVIELNKGTEEELITIRNIRILAEMCSHSLTPRIP